MSFMELVEKTRSCRRFEETELPDGFLESLIDVARVCPSGQNKQPLKYLIIDSPDFMNRLFPHLMWAGSIKDWDGPMEGERPTGYLAMILDKKISKTAGLDTGIVAQTQQLAAMDQGIGSCMIGSFRKKEIEELLELDDTQELQLILALGYPKEKRVLVDAADESNVSYYRDEKQVHYVPKRSAATLLIRKI